MQKTPEMVVVAAASPTWVAAKSLYAVQKIRTAYFPYV
jgi:hypothetical protein